MPLVDVDDPNTWPYAVRSFMDRYVAESNATAGAWRGFEAQPALVQELRGHKLLAYHCTRLFDHEVSDVKAAGLRLLTDVSVRERVAAAHARGVLPARAREYAETYNVFAIGNAEGREGQVCCVLGRGVFDHDAGGVEPFFETWGGEALRGGPADPPTELAHLGRPTIVVVKVDPLRAGWHSYPALPDTFAEALRRGWPSADLFWRAPIPGSDIRDVWQPGNPEYDRHDLPID